MLYGRYVLCVPDAFLNVTSVAIFEALDFVLKHLFHVSMNLEYSNIYIFVLFFWYLRT